MRDLLEQPSLDLTAAVLSHPDADLRWVATSELADPTPYLEGGEVLLTTGLGTADWSGSRSGEWIPFVSRLVEAGVVALGLGVGLTYAEPPAALVAACREQQLNLLLVPRAVSFVAISRSAARLLERREDAEAKIALTWQHRLTLAASEREPRSAITERLAALLAGEASLIGPDRAVVAGSLRLDVAGVSEALDALDAHGVRGSLSSVGPHGSLIVVPVSAPDGEPSHLAAAVPGRMSEIQRGLVRTAVALLSLIAHQEQRSREHRRDLAARALSLVGLGQHEAAMLVANAAGVTSVPREGAMLRAEGTGAPELLEHLERRGLLAAMVDGEVYALLPDDEPHGLPHASVRIGVGPTTATAGRALRRTTAERPLVRWADLVQDGPLALVEPDVAADFAADFLAGLDPVLVETLEVFCRRHGARVAVAAELGVHRNTVRHRVEHIEAVLGRSLDDPDTFAAAWLALRARHSPRRL